MNTSNSGYTATVSMPFLVNQTRLDKVRFHFRRVFAPTGGVVALRAVVECLLGCRDILVLARPGLEGGLLDGTGERKGKRPRHLGFEASVHGIEPRRGYFSRLAARQESHSGHGGGNGPKKTRHGRVGHLLDAGLLGT